MGKYSRKPSAAQRDKIAIAVAKKLKERGILSKQVKLHGGKYISKEVLRKVRDMQHLAALNYAAIPVSKKLANEAKQKGYMVVQGNRIIGPKTKTFKKRLEENILGGIKPVKGGYMEEVTLPHSIYDLRSLVANGSDLNDLKLSNEYFAFKFHGNESYRAFPNSKQLLDYLMHYRGISRSLSDKPEDQQEQFEALTIFRLHPNDVPYVIPGPTKRRERAKQAWKGKRKSRNYVPVDKLTDIQKRKRKQQEKLKAQRRRERMTEQEKERYREAGRERARKSQSNRRK